MYPLACMILHLCRDARVTICYCDTLHTTGCTIYISIIRDKANEAAPRRWNIVELYPLSYNLLDTIELAQGIDLFTSEPTDTTPAELAHATSRAPIYSRSTEPSVELVPLMRVHKL